ncbi:hypothetical protein D3C72_2456900 [compost metagenome]
MPVAMNTSLIAPGLAIETAPPPVSPARRNSSHSEATTIANDDTRRREMLFIAAPWVTIGSGSASSPAVVMGR